MIYTKTHLKSISTEVFWLTPELAALFRSDQEGGRLFERQRPLGRLNVDRLTKELLNGTFVAGMPLLFAVMPSGKFYMLNGNHTCEAVKKSGVSLPMTAIYINVKDFDEAARIYSLIDIQKVKTWMDALQARGFKEEYPMARSVMSAVGFITSGYKYDSTNKSQDERFDAMERYRVPAGLLQSATTKAPQKNSQKFKQVPVLAVALTTAMYQPSMAVEFWGGFVFDDGLAANDPRKALMRYLMNITSAGATKWPELARAASVAWNAHFEGRPLQYCKPSTMDELRISGTHIGRKAMPTKGNATSHVERAAA